MGGLVRPAIVDGACGTRRWIRRRPTPGGVAERIVRRRSASPLGDMEASVMPHIIDIAIIDRLAHLAGVPKFSDWKLELRDNALDADALLNGAIAEAWSKCLPTWIELGRVRDLSHGIRVSKYFPSFATRLGRAFAERFLDESPFLVQMLEAHPANSHEYLCAVDILEFQALDLDLPGPNTRASLFGLPHPVPAVIIAEMQWNDLYAGVATVGDYLRQRYEEEWGEEES